MCSLNDTDAPTDIHLDWKRNKSAEKGDCGHQKVNKLRSIYENASRPGSFGGVQSYYSVAKNTEN